MLVSGSWAVSEMTLISSTGMTSGVILVSGGRLGSKTMSVSAKKLTSEVTGKGVIGNSSNPIFPFNVSVVKAIFVSGNIVSAIFSGCVCSWLDVSFQEES